MVRPRTGAAVHPAGRRSFSLRNAGPFQFHSPRRCIAAGTMYVLTTRASTRMAKHRAKPICYIITVADTIRVPKVPAMITPHMVMTYPECSTACSMASSLDIPLLTWYSRIRVVSRMS